jgi:DNA polymerase I
MRTTHKVIESHEEVHQLVQYCIESGQVCVDFETNGVERYNPEFIPTILSVSFQPGSSWVLPLAHKESPFIKDWKKVFKIFCGGVITNPAIVKIAWNLGFEYSIFLLYGFRMRGRIFDAMLAKYILDEVRPHDLKSMVGKLLPEFDGYDLPGAPGPKASRSAIVNFWSNIPLKPLAKYGAGDADFTHRISLHLENKLIKNDLYHLFRSLYMPLVRILAPSYLSGIPIDRTWIAYLETKYQGLIIDLEKSLRKIPEVEDFQEIIIEERVDEYVRDLKREIKYGALSERQKDSRWGKINRVESWDPGNGDERKLFEPLNFSSPKQLIELLYSSEDGFQLPIIEKTDSGQPSTGEDTLKKLKSQDDTGFISKLLELRGLTKLKSTYITNILEESVDGKNHMHPSYLLHGTVSGRTSSKNPNIQNIPRVTTNPDIKRYIVTPQDFFFLEIDGSQMELRVAAEMFKDKAMIEIFQNKQNIHVATAGRIYGVDYGLINKARKDSNHPQHEDMVKKHKVGKVLNFTIFYGATAYKVSEFVTERTGHNVSLDEAQDLIDAWFESFPQAAAGIKKWQKKAKADGYVSSPLGRKRRLPILLDGRNMNSHRGEYNEALRQAVNAPIQGFASDITQWANINIYEASLRGHLPDYFKLLSTVHDSLEYPIHKTQVHGVVPKVCEIAGSMKGLGEYLGYSFKHVEMQFSAELGITWGHTEEYDPNMDYIKKYDEDLIKWNNERNDLGLPNFY